MIEAASNKERVRKYACRREDLLAEKLIDEWVSERGEEEGEGREERG